MSIETDFRAAALAHAPLVALVGPAGVALNAIPEGQALPYVVYTVSHAPEAGLDGQLAVDTATVTAQCWAANALQAVAVAQALQAAVDAHDAASGGNPACWVDSSSTGFDPELGLDTQILSITWIAQP